MINIGTPQLKNCGDWNSILRSFKTYTTDQSVVLEIGASSKDKTAILSKFCKKLIGLELFRNRVPKNFANVKYINGDWQKLSQFVKPNTIDLAISTHTIEHIADDLRAINELRKVLKPQGVALINTPNRKRLTRFLIELATGVKKFPYLPHEHIREYSEMDLVKLIDSSHFKKYNIYPVALGLHGGNFYCYIEKVPRVLRSLANFWEIHLFKD